MQTAMIGPAGNDAWIEGLAAGRGETTAALRDRLRRGLAAALAGRSDVDDADLDDFAQDAVMRILDRLDTFRGDSAFTTWAMAIAVRIGLTALRRRRWRSEPIDTVAEELVAPESSDSVSASRHELITALRRAIDEVLTSHQRRVISAELQGVPMVVLSEELGATPGAIYKASHDARKKLKTALARMGFDVESMNESLSGDSR